MEIDNVGIFCFYIVEMLSGQLRRNRCYFNFFFEKFSEMDIIYCGDFLFFFCWNIDSLVCINLRRSIFGEVEKEEFYNVYENS